jgi:acyl-coenzyme A synthetase/AMP-(fatty) acid ligase
MAAISAADYDWGLPEQFNFTRDVVEYLAGDPHRRALTFVDDYRVLQQYTFAQLSVDAARWAHVLRGTKAVPQGGRVLVLVGKVPAWTTILLGALKGGIVAVPCPEQLRARDLAFRVRHCDASLLVADRRAQDEVDAMQGLLERPVAVLYLDEAEQLLQRQPSRAPTEDTRWYEDAFILYTSGTTREPKGVTHTHAYSFATRMQAECWLGARPGDVVWCTAGTGWAKSIWNVLLGPWSRGAEIILHDSPFDGAERLDLIDRLGVTILCQAPTEYRLMAKLDGLERYPLSRLRHAVSAGEPLNPQVVDRFREAFQLTVHDGYGQTENTLLVANMLGTEVRPGSMGIPTPGHHVAVIDEQGKEMHSGEEGDVALLGRPPSLFDRYWEATEETAAVFRGDWYVTGDRATRDEDGYFWFAGRADDVILSAAYRIGPFEVESVLLEHPAVAESAVVGKPDPNRGQIVKAFVVLRPGLEGSDDLVRELQDHAKRVTAPYKYPREIEFVPELPKTRSGKIRRAELRALEESRAQEGPPAAEQLRAASTPLEPTTLPLPGDRRDEPEFLSPAERHAFDTLRTPTEPRREGGILRARRQAQDDERAARKAAEAAERERAQQEAERAKAEREAAERKAREAARREKAKREAAERKAREDAKAAKVAEEAAERKAREDARVAKAAAEAAEREAREEAKRAKAEQQASERKARDEAKAARAAQEVSERHALEDAKRRKAVREARERKERDEARRAKEAEEAAAAWRAREEARAREQQRRLEARKRELEADQRSAREVSATPREEAPPPAPAEPAPRTRRKGRPEDTEQDQVVLARLGDYGMRQPAGKPGAEEPVTKEQLATRLATPKGPQQDPGGEPKARGTGKPEQADGERPATKRAPRKTPSGGRGTGKGAGDPDA